MRQILFWVWLAIATAAAANAQRYPILPIPSSPPGVTALMQDSRSAVWVGTIDDVFCFDGSHFYSLRQYGFPREQVRSLAEDSDGSIWIATSGSDVHGGEGEGGIYRYKQGKIEKLFSGDVLSVVRIAPGVLLASFQKAIKYVYGELYLIRKINQSWRSEKIRARSAIGISLDHKGAALFPCPGGWCEFSHKQLVDWPDSGTEPAFTALPEAGEDVINVLRDQFNCVWFRGETHARYRCPGDSTIKALPDVVASIDVTHLLAEAADGSILLLGAGMFLGRPGAFHVVGSNANLPHSIGATLIEKDGTILLGADDGLHRFMYPFRLEYWNESDGPLGGLSIVRIGNRVFSAFAGVSVLSTDRTKWSQLIASDRLPSTVHLIPGPSGTILAASLTRGVTQFTADGRILASSLKGPGVDRLADDSNGHVWLAGLGIHRLIRSGNRFLSSPEGNLTGTSLDMEYDKSSKTLWACLQNEVVALQAGTWRHISHGDGLLNNYCRTVTPLPNGDVWMAYGEFAAFTQIKGAFSPNMSVQSYASGGEVGDAHTNFLGVDSRGWLWRASEHDNYLATPESAERRQWLHLDRQDGIPDPGGNQNSFYNDPDGSVWFSNNGTIVHFNPPDGFATRFAPPQVFIAGLAVGGNNPFLADTLQSVPHSQGIIAHIGSLQFDRRHALRLRYRVIPGDQQWKETASFEIPLGKLVPGRHILQVQGRLFTGEWSGLQSTSFQVLWPMWLTWLYLLLYAAGGSGLVFSVSAWRKRQELEKNVVLPDLSAWRMAALSPETEHLIGTTIDDRYEIGHILSVGGLATVARARDTREEGSLCAIKIFRLGFSDEEWIRHRFDQEVAALEQLSHPNIVKITGHGKVDTGAPYLVMEFIQGTSLRDLLLEKGALSRQQTASLLSQIASALQALHQRSIYHRDLKPENFMIRSDADNAQQIVLIDFSIALVKSPEQTFHGISRVAGTLDYMAPEQLTGYADSSTDIHSLAKVVIEMLSGSRWSDLFQWATLDMPGQARLYFTRTAYGLSDESIGMIASALAFDPAQRPKNAIEFARLIIRDLGAAS